jgi:membrane protein implicated in regulation of membrane protease activity
MANNQDTRRRWLGVFFLAAALAMLVVGQTVLKESLSPRAFLAYWLACFVFTCLAILVALLDFSAIRRRTRQEHRDMFHDTLQQIARKKQSRDSPDRRTSDVDQGTPNIE